MKYILLISALLFCSTSVAESFTLYLIRHAEKDLATKIDPDLTEQGRETAAKLNQYLMRIPLTKVYSSDYKRTRHTAQPIASQQKLTISIYDPRKLAEFAKLLLSEKQSALIVGHSNTTPELIRLVGGEAEAMSEDEYGELFIVTVDSSNNQVTTRKINL